jgi:6-phosphofructokinase 1
MTGDEGLKTRAGMLGDLAHPPPPPFHVHLNPLLLLLLLLLRSYAGFIAAHATLASGDVDLCLVPEVPVVLGDGPASILTHLRNVVARKGHAVVVVAEGAGEEEMAAECLAAGKTVEVDGGGNRKLPPVGEWLQRRVTEYFAAAGLPAAVRYIDPSYTIRSGACVLACGVAE